MGKAKKERDTEVRIRDLRNKIKSLERENGRLRKRQNVSDLDESDDNKTVIEQPEQNALACKSCNSNKTSILELGIRKYINCNDCGKRNRITK
jgi:hypothetical protein